MDLAALLAPYQRQAEQIAALVIRRNQLITEMSNAGREMTQVDREIDRRTRALYDAMTSDVIGSRL
jgi:cytidylate kinase